MAETSLALLTTTSHVLAHPHYTMRQSHEALGIEHKTLGRWCERADIERIPDRELHPEHYDLLVYWLRRADLEHLAALHEVTLREPPPYVPPARRATGRATVANRAPAPHDTAELTAAIREALTPLLARLAANEEQIEELQRRERLAQIQHVPQVEQMVASLPAYKLPIELLPEGYEAVTTFCRDRGTDPRAIPRMVKAKELPAPLEPPAGKAWRRHTRDGQGWMQHPIERAWPPEVFGEVAAALRRRFPDKYHEPEEEKE